MSRKNRVRNLFARERYNPLKYKDFRAIKDWEEWLTFWDTHSEVPILTGLLHEGFNVKCDNPVARATFYLRIADGHLSFHNHEIFPERCELREKDVIRHKAFGVLCSKLFSDNRTRTIGDSPYWQWIAESAELLQEIIRFFRLDWKFEIFENLTVALAEKEPTTRKAMDFLWSLCHAAFKPRDHYMHGILSKKASQNLQAVRPALIPIVHGLGHYDLLVYSEYGTATKEVVLALGKFVRQRLGQFSKPISTKESIARGWPPALALVQLLAMCKHQAGNPLWRA